VTESTASGGHDIDGQTRRRGSPGGGTEVASRGPRRPGHERSPIRHRGRGDRRGDHPGPRPLNRPDSGGRPFRALLYDADGRDREIELEPGLGGRLDERQLLWIDLGARDAAAIDTAAAAVGIGAALARRLVGETGRADLTQFPDQIHVVVESMEPPPSPGTESAMPERRELDLVAGRNWVVTVHDGPIAALDRIDALTHW
jgi:Mg2+ and Co2+ transporter CorA